MSEAIVSLEKFNAIEDRRRAETAIRIKEETERQVGQLKQQTSRLQVALAEKDSEMDQLRQAIPQLERKASDGEVHRREAGQLKEQKTRLQLALAEKEQEVSDAAAEREGQVQQLLGDEGLLRLKVEQLQATLAEKDAEMDGLREMLKKGAEALRSVGGDLVGA